MAHVEVSKLSGQELAELSCTYAALLLHDDQQDITGTSTLIQEKKSENSSLLLASKFRHIGQNFSLRPFKVRISTPFLTMEVHHHRLQLLVSLPKLPLSLKRKLRKKEAKNNKRRRKPHPLLPRKKTLIWVTSLVDSLSDK